MNCFTAPLTIGPRQITACIGSTRNPIDITFTPHFSIGEELVAGHPGAAGDAHHERDARAVDVGVHESHLGPVRRERHGEVDRDRRLADAALAGGHRDRVLHAGEDRRPSGACSCCVTFEVIATVTSPTPGDRGPDRLDGGGLQLVADRTGGRRQLDGEADIVPLDREVLDEIQRDDVPVEVGILDGPEGFEDVRLVQRSCASISKITAGRRDAGRAGDHALMCLRYDTTLSSVQNVHLPSDLFERVERAVDVLACVRAAEICARSRASPFGTTGNQSPLI